MILLALACVPEVKESSPTPNESQPQDTQDTSLPDDPYEVLVATTDYQTGALSRIQWPNGTIEDAVTATSADTAISVSGDTLFVLGRSSENTVRAYGSDLTVPLAEFATGEASNPHDVEICTDSEGNKSYIVALYNESGLGVYSKDGVRTGTIDLSTFNDDSGTPEPDNLYVAPNGKLYVAMNRLNVDYRGEIPGILAKIDCTTLAVESSWEIVNNAHFFVDPLDPDALYLTGGNYYTPDYSGPELDGGAWRFDTSTDVLGAQLADEATAGKNIGFYLPRTPGDTTSGSIQVHDDGYQWSILCFGPDGDFSTLLDGNMYVAGASAAQDGALWLSTRPGFGSGTTREGLIRVDRAACEVTDQKVTALPPASLAVRQ